MLSMELGDRDIRAMRCVGRGRLRAHSAGIEGWAQATGKRIDEKKAMAPENQSIERLVDPDDIAALAVFLASDAVVNLDAADR
jgi:NAD(P)-dependent dehydrogenase (short-subunit alcohol dehydrogenase family)